MSARFLLLSLLLLCTPAMAQDVEVESLPAIPILSDKTPSAVAPKNPPPLNSDDMGMSGVSGGSSVYDLKKNNVITTTPTPQTQTHTPAATPAQNTITDWNVNQDFSSRGDDPKLANKKFCTLKVSFASMASGPDHKTADKIKSYLDGNGDKLTYTQIPWGKEGEFDYCVDVSEHKNRSEIYKDIKRLLPPKSVNIPPTHITGAGFETITTN